MAYIPLDDSLPGMRRLLAYRPDLAGPMTSLMQAVMRSSDGLTLAEREHIAAQVSTTNQCVICASIHTEVARVLDRSARQIANEDGMKRRAAILGIAMKINDAPRTITTSYLEQVKSAGLSDREIHDTVLIASIFAFLNRYVDGLGLLSYDTEETLCHRAEHIAHNGYQ